MQKSKLSSKDSIITGALGANIVVIRFVTNFFGGISPYVWFSLHFVDTILIGPVFMLMVAKTHKEVAKVILDQVDLIPYCEQHPMSLSGGQKQRLSVADGMLSGKEILIFDEPTSGLDLKNMERVSEIMKQLSEIGKCVILITRDEELIEKTNAKVICWNAEI